MSSKREKLSHVAQFLVGGSLIMVETKADEEATKCGKYSSTGASDLERVRARTHINSREALKVRTPVFGCARPS